MQTIKLIDVCEFVRNGANIKQLSNETRGIPITRIETLANDRFNRDRLGYANITDDSFSDYYLKRGDVLLSHINGAKFIGRSVMYEPEEGETIIHGMNLLCLRFKSNYNPKFFCYYAKSKAAKNYFDKHTKKAVNQASITSTDIKNMPIPDISLEEQNKIVTIMDLLFERCDSLEKNNILFDELIKSRFVEMFETIDLSEQKDNWSCLEDITDIYTGTTPSTKDSSLWDGDVLWITPAEMDSETFYVYDTNRKITEKGKKSKSLDLMPVGTVLLSTRAPIGKVGIVGRPMACNQGFKNFYCSKKMNPIYLYVLLKNNTEFLNSLGSGTTFLEVSKTKIGKTRIPVPKIETQNQYATFVLEVMKSKNSNKKELNYIKELINKKMSDYFFEFEED